MKNELISILLLCMFCITPSIGQDQKEDYTSGLTKFIYWISDIDKILTKIDDKEKLKRIYRQLGYASEDIDNIALGKADLANKVSVLSKIAHEDLYRLQQYVDIIIEDIESLNERLIAINNELTHTDHIEVDMITKKLRQISHSNNILLLDNLEQFLYGSENQLQHLQAVMNETNAISDNLIILIQEAKTKIKEKVDN